MHGATQWRPHGLAVVLTLSALVYASQPDAPRAVAQISPPQAKAKRPPSIFKSKPTDDVLPRGVVGMVEQIKAAIQSGRLEDLNDAVDWNEMKPDFGPDFGPNMGSDSASDPVTYWKSISKDGDGRDILDVLAKLLAGKPAIRPLGRDLENNRLYVWPSFADTLLSKLSSAEVQALKALVPDDQLGAMRDGDRYTGWRLTLGADGTWHSFRRN